MQGEPWEKYQASAHNYPGPNFGVKTILTQPISQQLKVMHNLWARKKLCVAWMKICLPLSHVKGFETKGSLPLGVLPIIACTGMLRPKGV